MGHAPSTPGISELLNRESGFTDVNRDLMLVGGRINAYDDHGFTPLHRAILRNSLREVQCLIDLGGDPQVKTKCGSSAFHLAAKTGSIDSTC